MERSARDGPSVLASKLRMLVGVGSNASRRAFRSSFSANTPTDSALRRASCTRSTGLVVLVGTALGSGFLISGFGGLGGSGGGSNTNCTTSSGSCAGVARSLTGKNGMTKAPTKNRSSNTAPTRRRRFCASVSAVQGRS